MYCCLLFLNPATKFVPVQQEQKKKTREQFLPLGGMEIKEDQREKKFHRNAQSLGLGFGSLGASSQRMTGDKTQTVVSRGDSSGDGFHPHGEFFTL